MTTETIRAAFEAACAQHAEDAGYEGHERLARDGDGYADPHTQAAWWGWCEARQSPEIQAMRKDAERLRKMLKEAAAELDCLGSEIERIHRENPSIVATLPASNVLSMVRDAAMEQQI